MADAFSHEDTKKLLRNKHIFYLGDSNTRAQYKDLVWLLKSNTLITKTALRGKLERSYLGDELVSSSSSSVHRGRGYNEVRKFKDRNSQTTVEFMFIARCYNEDLKQLFNSYKSNLKNVPDVIVINSCLWDLTRWGPNGVPEYKDNMVKLMRLMSRSLPKSCLVIWTTALPAASHVGGGLIIKQIEFMQSLLRFEVMEANTFARELVASYGFDVLDNHYHMRMQVHRLFKDGVHYTSCPVRLMTNMLLTHCALSWGVELPGNISSISLTKAINHGCEVPKDARPVKLPSTKVFLKMQLPSQTVPASKGLKAVADSPGLKVIVDSKTNVRKCQHLTEPLPNYPQYQAPFPSSHMQITWNIPQNRFHPGATERYVTMPTLWDTPQIIPPDYQYFSYNQPEHNVGPFRRTKSRSGKKKKSNPYWNNRNPW